MSNHSDPLRIWIVDPINYSGMAYYDAGLAGALATAGADVTLFGSDQALVRPVQRDGLRFAPTFVGTAPHRPRWRRAISYGLSALRLARQLRGQNTDWLLWNYIEQPTLDRFVIRRARSNGMRLGFIAHETQPWETDRRRRDLYRWLVEEASDVVIVHGETNAQALRETWSVPPDRVIVSEHGDYRAWLDPSADREAARRRLGLPEGVPIALFFGALRMTKGLETLLAAWPMVREAVPEAKLVIAGRPYRGTDPTKLSSPPAGVLIRLGQLSAEQASDYYAACNVVTIPYDRVSTSGVLRFAYSAARPVVASDAGELRVHVQDGRTGWLVDPGDSGATAQALVAALADTRRASAFGAAGRAYAEDVFDWDAIAARLHRSLAERAGRPAGR